MTATTASSSPATEVTPAGHQAWRVSDRGVMRSEWIKLRSVRSNVVTLLAAGAVLIGFGVLFSALAGDTAEGPGPGPGLTDSLSTAFAGMDLAQLVLGVLGALVVTSEYASGLIRTMFAAVPKRIPVLRAKAVTVGSATWIVMTVAAFVTFFAAQAVYAGDEATFALTDDGVLRVVFGVGAYSAGVVLMGVALGFLLRSTASAVATLIAGLMIVPGLSGLLPDSFGDTVTKILPSNAGESFTQLTPTGDMLSWGAGLAVFAAWVVGLLALAGWTLRHRDA
jgi:ABC-2 type transport system permease protein